MYLYNLIQAKPDLTLKAYYENKKFGLIAV